MSAPTQGAFEADVLTAVMGHMNGHHREDCILIARAFGELPDVKDAVLIEMSPDAAVFTAITGEAAVDVTVPWSRPVTVRPDLRDEMARMYRDACHALGITPRQNAE